jgi:hypothetical protein
MNTRSSKPQFIFPPLSDSAKKAKKLLEPKRKPGTSADDALAHWVTDTIVKEELFRLKEVAKVYNVELSSMDINGIRFAYLLARDHIKDFGVLSSKRGTTANALQDNSGLVQEIDEEIERFSKAGKIKDSVKLPATVIRNVQKRGREGKDLTAKQIRGVYDRARERRNSERDAILAALEQACKDLEKENKLSLSSLGNGIIAP